VIVKEKLGCKELEHVGFEKVEQLSLGHAPHIAHRAESRNCKDLKFHKIDAGLHRRIFPKMLSRVVVIGTLTPEAGAIELFAKQLNFGVLRERANRP
jgi:hypothetical protein